MDETEEPRAEALAPAGPDADKEIEAAPEAAAETSGALSEGGVEPAPPGELDLFRAAFGRYLELCTALDAIALQLPAAQAGTLRQGCGDCARQTPFVYGLEAQFAAVQIGQLLPPADRNLARRRTEEWLARPLPLKRGQRGLPAERCPYLMSDGRCLIEAGRPLDCRLMMLPEAFQPRAAQMAAGVMGELMRFAAAEMPRFHNYVLLPAGVFAFLAQEEGRNVRKDIRRLKLDARRFTAWPAPALIPPEPPPAAGEAAAEDAADGEPPANGGAAGEAEARE